MVYTSAATHLITHADDGVEPTPCQVSIVGVECDARLVPLLVRMYVRLPYVPRADLRHMRLRCGRAVCSGVRQDGTGGVGGGAWQFDMTHASMTVP